MRINSSGKTRLREREGACTGRGAASGIGAEVIAVSVVDVATVSVVAAVSVPDAAEGGAAGGGSTGASVAVAGALTTPDGIGISSGGWEVALATGGFAAARFDGARRLDAAELEGVPDDEDLEGFVDDAVVVFLDGRRLCSVAPAEVEVERCPVVERTAGSGARPLRVEGLATVPARTGGGAGCGLTRVSAGGRGATAARTPILSRRCAAVRARNSRVSRVG